MRTDEPMEELKLTRLGDDHVLGHRVDIAYGFLGLAMIGDHADVHLIEGTEVFISRSAPEAVIIPAALGYHRARSSPRRLTQCRNAFGGFIDHRQIGRAALRETQH